MVEAETRFLRQCTYTPIDNRSSKPDGAEELQPSVPLLKSAVLSIVFPRRASGAFLLRATLAAAREQRAAGMLKVADAVPALWASDVRGAVAILTRSSLDDVIAFARLSLECDQHLLSAATVAALATMQHLEAELANDGRDDVMHRDFRASISKNLAGLRARVSGRHSAGGAQVRPVPTPPGSADVHKPAEAKDQPSEISLEQLESALARQSAEAKAYLSEARFFGGRNARLDIGETQRRLDVFRAAKQSDLRRKHATLLAIESTSPSEPVGYLHLERIDFEPIGYTRGDLVYTLPLLPGETVRLTHREWSRTESEYITLVSDSLESAADEAISENAELTESFGSEQDHSSAFNVSATASGGYGPVSVSTTAGYNSQNADSQSRESSATRTKEVTKKASSRSKREHKVTFRIASEAEVEDTSYREIANETDVAVRWDYYRLLRQWQVSLYRYGIRLTYDVVVPEPGSYLLRRYIELRNVERQIEETFHAEVQPSDLTRENWQARAAEYETSLEPPPTATVSQVFHAEQSYASKTVGIAFLELELPAGYHFSEWHAEGSSLTHDDLPAGNIDANLSFNTARLNAGARASNNYSWRYSYDWSEASSPHEGSTLTISVWVRGTLTDYAFQDWQQRNYQRIIDAALTRYETRRLRLTARRDALIAETARVQGLSLRKLEQEEIMKAVLRWILGADFAFYPADLPPLDLDSDGDLSYYDPESQSVLDQYFEPTISHGAHIRFLHQAIEWENVNYVLYPYFWTDDYRWDFKQAMFHEDSRHRDFLRSGAARVVLTIRPGFEEAFLTLMETGTADGDLPNGHPYVTVADELKATASTNFPYTPGPHHDDPKNMVDQWIEFTPTGALDVALASHTNE